MELPENSSILKVLFTFLVVSLKAVVTIPKILTVNRESTGTVTCTGTGQPGLTTSFKSSGSELNDSDLYKVEAENLKDTSVDGKTTRELKVTAKASSIVSAYTTCKVTDQTNGLVKCEKVLECSASYPGIASSDDTKSFTVNVTNLKGKANIALETISYFKSQYCIYSVFLFYNICVGMVFLMPLKLSCVCRFNR